MAAQNVKHCVVYQGPAELVGTDASLAIVTYANACVPSTPPLNACVPS